MTATVDQRVVRRGFSAAASDYSEAGAVHAEIGRRLDDHFEGVVVAPTRVLDVGAADGAGARGLAKRFRRARVVGVDLSAPMCRAARAAVRRPFRRDHYVCGHAAALPFGDGTFDVVRSSTTLQWCPDPRATLAEWARVLTPGGLLIFSTLGPDTFHEIRAAWAGVDDAPHTLEFADMHDVGDALTGLGLGDVVMEAEHLAVAYRDARAALAEIRRQGVRNARADRVRHLTGRRRYARMLAALGAERGEDGVRITYEVVYGLAWKGVHEPRRIPVEVLRNAPQPPEFSG